jgi:hypothetical protein
MLPAYGQYAVSLLQICCQPIANRLTAYKGYACRIFGFCCAGNAFSTGRRILRPVRAGDAYPFPLFPYAALPPTLRSPLRSAPGTFGGDLRRGQAVAAGRLVHTVPRSPWCSSQGVFCREHDMAGRPSGAWLYPSSPLAKLRKACTSWKSVTRPSETRTAPDVLLFFP